MGGRGFGDGAVAPAASSPRSVNSDLSSRTLPYNRPVNLAGCAGETETGVLGVLKPAQHSLTICGKEELGPSLI